ncbi:hypothetical protein ACFX1R_042795 [Malus domestica]
MSGCQRNGVHDDGMGSVGIDKVKSVGCAMCRCSVAVLCGCARSVAVLGGSATDAQWLCSVAVQRLCSGCVRWLGSVAMLWVLAGSDVKVTSTSSVSCLAAANDFNNRRQTTSRS